MAGLEMYSPPRGQCRRSRLWGAKSFHGRGERIRQCLLLRSYRERTEELKTSLWKIGFGLLRMQFLQLKKSRGQPFFKAFQKKNCLFRNQPGLYRTIVFSF